LFQAILGRELPRVQGLTAGARLQTTDLTEIAARPIVGVERIPALESGELVAGCAARKVALHAIGPASIRCVTHKDVDAEDIERALEALRELTSRWQDKGAT